MARKKKVTEETVEQETTQTEVVEAVETTEEKQPKSSSTKKSKTPMFDKVCGDLSFRLSEDGCSVFLLDGEKIVNSFKSDNKIKNLDNILVLLVKTV